MNLFYLDDDLDLNAEYHIDKHVVKMPTEVAQMMTTTIWVDKLIGFVPRSLNRDELGILNAAKAKEPSIDERTFTRFLPAMPNHPCSIWIRSSVANYEWAYGYAHALNSEWQYRYGHIHDHKSFTAIQRLPEPARLSGGAITDRPLCVIHKLEGDPIRSYRNYYINEKASIASWKHRSPPPWWPQEKE